MSTEFDRQEEEGVTVIKLEPPDGPTKHALNASCEQREEDWVNASDRIAELEGALRMAREELTWVTTDFPSGPWNRVRAAIDRVLEGTE